MVHVGECRERNHTGKDGDEREAEGGRERNDEGKRDKPRPTHPDFLETENWIVASPVDLGRSLATDSRELDSRNRYQSLRIVCPASPSSYFDRRSPEPATVSRGHYSRSRSEKLHHSGDKLRCPASGSLEGNEIPRRASPRVAIKLPEISEGR